MLNEFQNVNDLIPQQTINFNIKFQLPVKISN